MEALAGEAMRGRGSLEDRTRAAEHVAAALAKAGLVPVPGAPSMLQDLGGEPGAPEVRNVLAWLPGRGAGKDPAAPGEYVILSAHHDHLGVRDGVVHPGADDNASGVAALLAAARRLAARGKEAPLRRSVLVASFDREEEGMIGSTRWCEKPALPLADCAAFLTMDMLGRSVLDATAGTVLVMGAERSAACEAAVAAAERAEGQRVAVLGADFNPGFSDYLPFAERKVPFLFLTTGAHADYHRPTDTPDRLDYPRLAQHAALAAGLVLRLADAEERPVWREPPEPRLAEVEAVRDLVAAIQPKVPELGLPDFLVFALGNFRKHLDGIVASGALTQAQRDGVKNTAKMLLKQAQSVPR